MAINFPINPSSGDTYVVNNITFTYNAANSAWTSNQNVDSTGTSVVVSDTPPPTPSAGDLWTNSVDMSLNIYYVDTTSSQWVDLNQTDIDLSGYDTSTQVDTKISNVSVDLSGYDTSVQVDTKIAAIPDTDLSAYDTSTQVDTKIAAIPDTDLSAYDTSVQVDTKIAAIPDTDLSAYDTSVQVDTKIAAIPDTDLSAYDTSAQVDIKVASIVDSAPETLNTLNELAAALGDDANHVSTMTTLVGTKADQSTTYTKTEVDTSLNLKSDKTTTYTKTEVDTSLNLKSDKTTTYTKTEVDSAVLSSWTEDANGHILPNTNDTHDIGSSTLKVRDIYMSGSTIHLGDQSISADADGIKMPAIKIGTGANAVSLSASSDGKLVQTATVGGVVQTPTSSTGASVIVSDTPPSSPSSGDLWTDSTTMKMFIYYEDADSSQWVGVSGSSGADGADGDIGPAGPVGPSGGLSVHLTPLDLPTTGSTGDQAYVESNTSIYVYDENITGWYRVALINATPTFTSTPDASYVFAIDGTPIVVTPVAVDPEGSLVTYSVVGDPGTVATMTSVDNVYTFTPSTDDANEGSFTMTFRATDGVNVSDAISNFSLVFVTYAVSLDFSNGLIFGQDYEDDSYNGQFTLSLHDKGAKIDTSPQYGIMAFTNPNYLLSLDQGTSFGRNEKVYIELQSPYRYGGIGLAKNMNDWWKTGNHLLHSDSIAHIGAYDDDTSVPAGTTSTLSMLINGDVTNYGNNVYIKFFLNGSPISANSNSTTFHQSNWIIVIGDGASSAGPQGGYIVTNPDYWTYDPEVLDQL